MSEHGHDEHGSHGHDDHAAPDSHAAHDSHGGHDEHGGHGHDDHGHGGGAGDYNTEPPGPSTLPAVAPWFLVLMGIGMACVLAFVVSTSLALGAADSHGKGHAEAAASHDGHTETKAAH
ncbi:MAG: hypothetical protein WCT04_01055 [Planctomycetota bacterium]